MTTLRAEAYANLINDLCSPSASTPAGGPIRIETQLAIQRFVENPNRGEIPQQMKENLKNLVSKSYSMADGEIVFRSIEIKDIIIKATAVVIAESRRTTT